MAAPPVLAAAAAAAAQGEEAERVAGCSRQFPRRGRRRPQVGTASLRARAGARKPPARRPRAAASRRNGRGQGRAGSGSCQRSPGSCPCRRVGPAAEKYGVPTAPGSKRRREDFYRICSFCLRKVCIVVTAATLPRRGSAFLKADSELGTLTDLTGTRRPDSSRKLISVHFSQ